MLTVDLKNLIDPTEHDAHNGSLGSGCPTEHGIHSGSPGPDLLLSMTQ